MMIAQTALHFSSDSVVTLGVFCSRTGEHWQEQSPQSFVVLAHWLSQALLQCSTGMQQQDSASCIHAQALLMAAGLVFHQSQIASSCCSTASIKLTATSPPQRLGGVAVRHAQPPAHPPAAAWQEGACGLVQCRHQLVKMLPFGAEGCEPACCSLAAAQHAPGW